MVRNSPSLFDTLCIGSGTKLVLLSVKPDRRLVWTPPSTLTQSIITSSSLVQPLTPSPFLGSLPTNSRSPRLPFPLLPRMQRATSRHSSSNLPPALPRPANPESLTFSSDYEDPEALPLHHNPHPRRTAGPDKKHFQQPHEMEVHQSTTEARRRAGAAGAAGGGGPIAPGSSGEPTFLGGENEKSGVYGASGGAGGGGVKGGRRDRPAYKPPAKTWVSP